MMVRQKRDCFRKGNGNVFLQCSSDSVSTLDIKSSFSYEMGFLPWAQEVSSSNLDAPTIWHQAPATATALPRDNELQTSRKPSWNTNSYTADDIVSHTDALTVHLILQD